MARPYHRFIFDEQRRVFVGEFEAMYQSEDLEGYDSWFQEDLRKLDKQISQVVLGRYVFQRVLDLGCGKGTFTYLLKKANNLVVGVDISATAIKRAQAKYPDVDFRTMSCEEALNVFDNMDLVLTMEILSYLPDWRDVVRKTATITQYYYLTLYLPDNPIGYVKSFDELLSEVSTHFVIIDEIYCNREQLLLLARSNRVEGDLGPP